jgi:hypothetical protein
MTPFKALYGRDPPTITRIAITETGPVEVREQLASRDE